MRNFAVSVVSRLREAGYEALWAGGCVRDALLGITPKDYDVATNATPQQVRDLFGTRQTLAVGESFGVIIVLGKNRSKEQIEVATFRADGEYLDGRRPSEVTFCSAEEDAKRRDFTINGMFFDPIEESVIDYVGGQEDLARRVVRAIGNPAARIEEDKLRMLRAVRFAATFQFALDEETADAIRTFAANLDQVSVERISAELRRMLTHETRATAVEMLADVQLLTHVFPNHEPDFDLAATLSQLNGLTHKSFEPGLAILLTALVPRRSLETECRRLRLSNAETKCIAWIADSLPTARKVDSQPLHVIKPMLADRRVDLLLDALQAEQTTDPKSLDAFKALKTYLDKTPEETLNPPPLVTGQHLQELGVQAGPMFKKLLTQIRNEQLDELLTNTDSALARINEITSAG